MLSQLLAKTPELPREKLFWGVVGVLVVGQLFAFWTLCSDQVRRAEVRDATLQVQRVAVAECLRYIPRATLNSCATRVDPNGRPDGNAIMAAGSVGERSAMSGAVPVSFVFR